MIALLRLVGALLLGLMLWRGFIALRPESPSFTPAHVSLAAQAAREAAPWFEHLNLRSAKTYFGTLDRDEFGFVTLPLRQSLVNLDKVDLVERSWKDRLRSEIGWTLPTCGGSRQLLEQARGLGCEYAIGGRVERFSQLEQQVDLVLELQVWEVAGQKLVDQKTIRLSNHPEQDGSGVKRSAS